MVPVLYCWVEEGRVRRSQTKHLSVILDSKWIFLKAGRYKIVQLCCKAARIFQREKLDLTAS
jgi:hypothetical protein